MAQLVFAHICHNAYFVKMYEIEIAKLFSLLGGDFPYTV